MKNRRGFIKQAIAGLVITGVGVDVVDAKKVVANPDGVILVTVPDDETDLKKVFVCFKKCFPDNKVLVMTENIKVEIAEEDANSIPRTS